MTKQNIKTVYTPRFGSQSLSQSVTKSTREIKITNWVDLFSSIKKTDIAKELKANRRKTGESVLMSKKETSSLRIQTPNKCTQISSEKKKEVLQANDEVSETRSLCKTNGDIFNFSCSDNFTPLRKSAVEKSVLKTTSKMLYENQRIRRRLDYLQSDDPKSKGGHA